MIIQVSFVRKNKKFPPIDFSILPYFCKRVKT
jgi:hypothetical protein